MSEGSLAMISCSGEPHCRCAECRSMVYCFRPDHEVAEYYLVAEGRKELKKRAAQLAEVDGDQCGDCGGPRHEDDTAAWVLHMETSEIGTKRYWVECTCGNQVTVVQREAREVIW